MVVTVLADADANAVTGTVEVMVLVTAAIDWVTNLVTAAGMLGVIV